MDVYSAFLGQQDEVHHFIKISNMRLKNVYFCQEKVADRREDLQKSFSSGTCMMFIVGAAELHNRFLIHFSIICSVIVVTNV